MMPEGETDKAGKAVEPQPESFQFQSLSTMSGCANLRFLIPSRLCEF